MSGIAGEQREDETHLRRSAGCLHRTPNTVIQADIKTRPWEALPHPLAPPPAAVMEEVKALLQAGVCSTEGPHVPRPYEITGLMSPCGRK